MSQTLVPMDIMSHIAQRIPQAEEVLSASAWFADETMTLDFGEYVGRPDVNAMMHTSLLTYFLANGWKVASVTNKRSGGEWESHASFSSTNAATSTSSTSAESSASGNGVSMSGEGYDGDVTGLTRSETTTESSGSSSSEGNTATTGSAAGESTSGGAPYWYAYQTITLTRRKMQSERVLNDMIASFTKAYNEGRDVNNSRYDELVALYALMLGRTEDEANAVPLVSLRPEDFTNLGDEIAAAVNATQNIQPSDLRSLYETALANVREALELFKANASLIPANWQAAREAEINRQFDNKVAAARATMVANGTYNGTTWPNVLSGFERDRQFALTDLADAMVTVKVDAYGKVATLTAQTEASLAEAIGKVVGLETTLADVQAKVGAIRQSLMESAVRVTEAIQKNRVGLTELRNTVLKWMFDFMERREDEYPGLDQLATIADRLGYSDGAVGGSLSS